MSVYPDEQFWILWMSNAVGDSMSPILGQSHFLRVSFKPRRRNGKFHFHARAGVTEICVPDDTHGLIDAPVPLHHGCLYITKVRDLVGRVMVINHQTLLSLEDTHFGL